MAGLFPAEAGSQVEIASAKSAMIRQLKAALASRTEELALERLETTQLRSQVRLCCSVWVLLTRNLAKPLDECRIYGQPVMLLQVSSKESENATLRIDLADVSERLASELTSRKDTERINTEVQEKLAAKQQELDLLTASLQAQVIS